MLVLLVVVAHTIITKSGKHVNSEAIPPRPLKIHSKTTKKIGVACDGVDADVDVDDDVDNCLHDCFAVVAHLSSDADARSARSLRLRSACFAVP